MSGLLSIVGTPIGNLGDITHRAVETLRSADRIYAEDTRRTRSLLSHLGIEGKKLIALHAHSSERTVETAVTILNEGHSISLVTDAGMPAVSDPGADLVSAAREAGIRVTVIPGPSAVTSAVALSGLVDGPFSFFGFLPRKGTKRKETLGQIAEHPFPSVFFESPHRIADTLRDLAEVCGDDRQVCVCRELTKKFEETLATTLGEFNATAADREWLGEFTVVIARGHRVRREDFDVDAHARLLIERGTPVKQIAQALTKELAARGQKSSRRELYRRVQRLLDDDPDSEKAANSDTEGPRT